jgi:zinc/manganese transport system substrate-binding protein
MIKSIEEKGNQVQTELRWMTFIVVTLISVCLLTGCGSKQGTTHPNPAGASGPKIKVVAAEDFYGEVAQAVGGDRVAVTSILNDPNVDPHEYEPTADASKAVADAQVVVYTGIGYDDWMDKLIKANTATNTKQVVAVGSDLLGRAAGDNPHVWYDPATMPKLADRLAEVLGQLDPGQAQDYQNRAKSYIRTLTPLTDEIARLKQPTPVAIDASEPVFGYLADALNLKMNDPKFAKAIEDGNDPNARDVINVQNDIKQKRIKFFVFNIQTVDPTVKNIVQLAESNGIPVVKVTETEPTGENYSQWMTGQLDQVGKTLGIQ